MEQTKKINEQAFESLLQLGHSNNNQYPINFNGYDENRIRLAIQKREDISFVIAYDLINDYIQKKKKQQKQIQQKQLQQQNQQSDKNNSRQNHIFQPIAENIRTPANPQVENLFYVKPEGITQQEQEFIGNWTYGKIYSLPAKVLMNYIFEALGQLNTLIKIKSPDYRIKCSYKIIPGSRKLSSYSNDYNDNIEMEEESNNNINNNNNQINNNNNSLNQSINQNQQQNLNNNQGNSNSNLNMRKGTQASANTEQSKRELIFTIQIYALPNHQDHIIDLFLNKGHTIIFLEFCNKFLAVLDYIIMNSGGYNQQLIQQQQMQYQSYGSNNQF